MRLRTGIEVDIKAHEWTFQPDHLVAKFSSADVSELTTSNKRVSTDACLVNYRAFITSVNSFQRPLILVLYLPENPKTFRQGLNRSPSKQYESDYCSSDESLGNSTLSKA